MLYIISIISFVLVAISDSSYAEVIEKNYVAIPLGPLSNSTEVESFCKTKFVKCHPVFGESEKTYLISTGSYEVQSIAHSFSVSWTVDSISESQYLDKKLKQLNLSLSDNPKVYLQRVHADQWGLVNKGQTQEIEISDTSSYWVNGKIHEDIGYLNAPREVDHHKVKVAIIDTGVQTTHPALLPYLRYSKQECESSSAYENCLKTRTDRQSCHTQYANQDNDGNGYPLDCRGWNVRGVVDSRTGIAGNNNPDDDIGHGTHVAGIVAMEGKVGSQTIKGVATQVELIPVKVLSQANTPTIFSNSLEEVVPDPRAPEFGRYRTEADVFARGVLYAIRSGAQIINLSLGYSAKFDSLLMRRMIALAIQRGIIVVAAAGNQGTSATLYPCRYAGVVCVGSFSADGAISHFSNYGDSVEIAAPGHRILSAWPTTQFPAIFNERKGYDFKNGTSMASPMVAGVAARLLNLGFSPIETVARLYAGARQSTIGEYDSDKKWVVHGNVSLSSSLQVKASPLFGFSNKDPLFLVWDRLKSPGTKTVVAKLSIQNFWEQANNVRIRVKSFEDSVKLVGTTEWVVPEFKTEARVVDVVFELNERSMGLFTLEVELEYSDLDGKLYTKKLNKSAEVIVPVRPQSQGGQIIMTNLRKEDLGTSYSMKPLSCYSLAKSKGNYLIAVVQRAGKTQLVLVKETPSGFRKFPELSEIPSLEVGFQMFSIACLENERNEIEIAITQFDPAKKIFSVLWLDNNFLPSEKNLKTEARQWSSDLVLPSREPIWIPSNKGWILGWVGQGKQIPQREKDNPWELPREERLRTGSARRLYVLTNQLGLRSFDIENPKRFVNLFEGSQLLVSEGVEFEQKYFLGNLRIQELSSKDIQFLWSGNLIQSSRYVHLSSMITVKKFTSENHGSKFIFTGLGPEAMNLRVSQLDKQSIHSLYRIKNSYDLISSIPWEPYSEPLGMMNGVLFVKSRFHVQVFEGEDGTQIGKSENLRLPAGRTRFTLSFVEGLPSLILGESEGAALSTDVISLLDGNLVRLAKFRTLAASGCEWIDFSATDATDLAKAYYYCGDHFIKPF